MLLPDVNILIFAHREDAESHIAYRDWLQDVLDSDEPFGLSELVLSGFVRVVTNPRAFKTSTPLNEALAFVEDLRIAGNCRIIMPGPRHWEIFIRLCKSTNARGGLVADAYHAALAIESGSEWITDDGDYARFPGLRWRRPF